MSVQRVSLRLRLLLILCVAAAGTASVRTAAQAPALSVCADNVLGPISPLIYGANDGPWSTVPPAMWPQAEDSGLTFLSFPGGEWGDQNNLTPFHIDLFMTLVKRMKVEPNIRARLRGGTPELAAELVRYVNIEKKYGVRYWSIGNEPDLYRDYSVEQLNRDWRKIADAMRAVDPSIIFLGPEVSQYPPSQGMAPGTNKYRDWVKGFLEANGGQIGVVAVHRYPFPKGVNAPTTTISELKDNAGEWDLIIPELRALIKETTGRDIPIGITEVNSHWSQPIGGVATPDSFYHAIWWADVLGHIIRQRVMMVAYFMLFHNVYGLLTRGEVRPTYYVYHLYRQLGTELLESESADAEVTITAALRSDGALTLIVVNPAAQAKSVALRISGFPAGPAEVWRLDQKYKAERIWAAMDITGSALDLPAQSVSLYIMRKP